MDAIEAALNIIISRGWDEVGCLGVVEQGADTIDGEVGNSEAVEAVEAGGVEEVDEFSDGDGGLGGYAADSAGVDFEEAEGFRARTLKEINFVRREDGEFVVKALDGDNGVAGRDADVAGVGTVEDFRAELGGIVEKVGGVGPVGQEEAIFVKDAELVRRSVSGSSRSSISATSTLVERAAPKRSWTW